MQWDYATVRIEATSFLTTNIDDDELQQALNDAGAKGWELASTETLARDGFTKCILLIFKRPRADG